LAQNQKTGRCFFLSEMRTFNGHRAANMTVASSICFLLLNPNAFKKLKIIFSEFALL